MEDRALRIWMTAALTMAMTAVMAVPHTIVSGRNVVLTTYLVLTLLSSADLDVVT